MIIYKKIRGHWNPVKDEDTREAFYIRTSRQLGVVLVSGFLIWPDIEKLIMMQRGQRIGGIRFQKRLGMKRFFK